MIKKKTVLIEEFKLSICAIWKQTFLVLKSGMFTSQVIDI